MKVNYPNQQQIKPLQKHTTQKGMLFESALNLSNEYYRNQNRAVIYKKPTPIQIVKVDYPKRQSARITEAYYQSKSTTDYNGIYKEKYIDYEAKETNNLSFNFGYIFRHQIDHLLQIKSQGGIAFVIVFFKKTQEVFLMDIADFYTYYQNAIKGNRKSIPIEIFREVGTQVKLGYTPPIDYLSAVDALYFKSHEK